MRGSRLVVSMVIAIIVARVPAHACPVAVEVVHGEAIGASHGYAEYTLFLDVPKRGAFGIVLRGKLKSGAPDIRIDAGSTNGREFNRASYFSGRVPTSLHFLSIR